MAKKTISVNISKSSIFEKVRQQTQMVGKKSATEGDYEVKGAFEEDEAELDQFWKESYGRVMDAVADYATNFDSSVEALKFDMKMPSSFNESGSYAMVHAIDSYMYNSIMMLWCEITDPERMKEYDIMANAALADLKALMLKKVVFKANEHNPDTSENYNAW